VQVHFHVGWVLAADITQRTQRVLDPVTVIHAPVTDQGHLGELGCLVNGLGTDAGRSKHRHPH